MATAVAVENRPLPEQWNGKESNTGKIRENTACFYIGTINNGAVEEHWRRALGNHLKDFIKDFGQCGNYSTPPNYLIAGSLSNTTRTPGCQERQAGQRQKLPPPPGDTGLEQKICLVTAPETGSPPKDSTVSYKIEPRHVIREGTTETAATRKETAVVTMAKT